MKILGRWFLKEPFFVVFDSDSKDAPVTLLRNITPNITPKRHQNQLSPDSSGLGIQASKKTRCSGRFREGRWLWQI